MVIADSEGKRIGQRSDSKSDAQQWVVGSNPMPSAPVRRRLLHRSISNSAVISTSAVAACNASAEKARRADEAPR